MKKNLIIACFVALVALAGNAKTGDLKAGAQVRNAFVDIIDVIDVI